MVNVAIIGISGFGAVHYRDLERYYQRKQFNIVGAVVINQDQEKEKCDFLKSVGCKLFTDYKQMLAELKGSIDLCFIPTGIAMHKEMSIAAMAAGANVYLEKPVAATIQEARDIMAAERQYGRFCAIGYQTMYQPETFKVKQLLLAGAIGKVKTIKCYAIWPRSANYYARNNWAGRLTVNGQLVLDSPFNNAMAHYLNLPCFWAGQSFDRAGELTTVQAGLFRANPIQSPDTAWIKAETAGGIDILFYVTHCDSRCDGPYTIIEGETGYIENTQRCTVVRRNNGEVVESFDSTPDELVRDNIMDILLKRLADVKQFFCSVEMASVQTLINNGAYESCPVIPVPAEAIVIRKSEDGSDITLIREIDQTMIRAFAASRLPDANDRDWIVNGNVVDMRNYQNFELKF